MHDSRRMRGGQCIGDLSGVGQGFRERKSFPGNQLLQRFAVDELHDQVVRSDVIERANIRMIQSGHRPGFEFEPLAEFGFGDLDCNCPAQARVARFPYFGHTAGAELAIDFIRSQLRPWYNPADCGSGKGAGKGRLIENQIRGGSVAGQERLDFFSQIVIALASFRQILHAMLRRALQRCVIHQLDLAPSLGSHWLKVRPIVIVFHYNAGRIFEPAADR